MIHYKDCSIINIYRYQILKQIGKGSYGQVFKVYDHKNKQQVALKMIKNKSQFSKQAFIQIQILTHIKQKDLNNNSGIIKIKDFLIFRKHVCIIFQLLNQNLYQLIIRNNYNGLQIGLIRRFAIQLLHGLIFLKKNKIIHCDLKPENILLKQYMKSGIKIIDFGSSCFVNQTIYSYIQSRYYRAPQITLSFQKYSYQIDLWSIGCILSQLYTGVPLFPGQSQLQQIKYITDTIGLPPNQFIQKGTRSHIFFQKQNNSSVYILKKEIIQVKSIDYFSKKLQQRIPDKLFRQFLQLFLKWNPKQRINPQQAINHEWILQGINQQERNTDKKYSQRKQNKSKPKQKKNQAAQQERIKRFLQHISIVGKKIYQIISQGPITKPQLRKRLSLPSKQLDDQLSALSSYNLIKALKKGGQKRGVNIWVIWSYAQGQQGQIKREGSQDVIQLILKKDSNIIQLKKQAIKNAYSLQGFNQILQMLKMKGEIFIEGQQIKLRKMKKLNIPCITCQLKSQCGPNNIINPNQCPYLLNW